MTAKEYIDDVVMPTVREFLASPGDRRRAYLACIATYHATDHVARARGDPGPQRPCARQPSESFVASATA